MAEAEEVVEGGVGGLIDLEIEVGVEVAIDA